MQPDWDALRSLFPVLLLVLFVAWFAWTTRKFATLGPTRRAPARIEPVTPAHVHMPGGSAAPILAALGAGSLFFGLVLGPGLGVLLFAGVILLVLTLLVWFREGMRDYAHLEAPAQTTACSCRPSSTRARRRACTCPARRSGRSWAPSARRRSSAGSSSAAGC